MTDLIRQEESFKVMMDKITELATIIGFNPNSGIGWDLKQSATIFKVMRGLLPFQEGDKVELVKTPDCTGGWSGCKHFLRKGEEATVSSLEIYDGKIQASVVFDNETWIDSKGVPQPVSSKHSFCFTISWLKKVEG